jgi:hypothetical protein
MVVLVCVFCSFLVAAEIQSINYPAPNQVITRTKNVPLNITSDASSDCYFSYSEGANVSVSCNGVTLVDFPSADGNYIIKVGDSSDNWIKQHVNIVKPSGAISAVIYFSVFALILLMFFLLFVLLVALAKFNVNIYHVMACWGSYFLFMFMYQMAMEYASMPFLLDWMDMILYVSGYMMIVGSLILYIVISSINSFIQRKNCFLPDWDGGFKR